MSGCHCKEKRYKVNTILISTARLLRQTFVLFMCFSVYPVKLQTPQNYHTDRSRP